MAETIMPRGSTLDLPLAFQTTPGGAAIDLTGKTLECFETIPSSLKSGVSMSITNIIGGLGLLHWVWDSAVTLENSVAEFRVRIVGGLGFEVIKVIFK